MQCTRTRGHECTRTRSSQQRLQQRLQPGGHGERPRCQHGGGETSCVCDGKRSTRGPRARTPGDVNVTVTSGGEAKLNGTSPGVKHRQQLALSRRFSNPVALNVASTSPLQTPVVSAWTRHYRRYGPHSLFRSRFDVRRREDGGAAAEARWSSGVGALPSVRLQVSAARWRPRLRSPRAEEDDDVRAPTPRAVFPSSLRAEP